MTWGNRPWGRPSSWVGTPRRGGFTPRQLTNLRGWWKSDTGITIVTGVSQWNDQSGQNNHLVQATGASQPVVTAAAINGLPAITFDGVDDFMAVSFTLAVPLTIFVVFRQVTWTSSDIVYDGNLDLRTRLAQSATTPGLVAGGSGGITLAQNNGLAVDTFGLTTAIYNGASSVFQVNNLTETTGTTGSASPDGITLGARGSKAVGFGNIGVAEVIIMAAVATAGERASVRAYSQARYGVGA